MIAETLIPARFCIPAIEAEPQDMKASTQAEPEKATLADWQDEILISGSQSRNPLLEERDRHIKDRLYRVAKIEAFALMLNNLVVQGEISSLELSQIIELKTQEINDNGNEIWLNLMTQEKVTPLFYNLTDK
ncbi:hypothetical protein AB9B48_09750 [Kluyvera ascorbata]|uniref:hypothetical protein n=1 Tax=Kluyvera ascorbata TaxID=51288 RepID=UPI00330E5BFE|nr:hypothetical protein [Kluyvera ascorbata]